MPGYSPSGPQLQRRGYRDAITYLRLQPKAVLLGAVADDAHPGMREAMAAISAAGKIIAPGSAEIRAFHERKYAVFLRMHSDFLAYRDLMAGPCPG